MNDLSYYPHPQRIPNPEKPSPAVHTGPGSGAMLHYVLLLQMIGCVLVILGHSYPYEGVPSGAATVRAFVYSFHMPLFVWCSGFLAVATSSAAKYRFREFLSKRATRLLLPYFVLSVVGLLPKWAFAGVLHNPLELGWDGLTRAFLVPRESVWGHFWFLPMIFFVGLIGYGIDRLGLRLARRNALLIGGLLVGAALTVLPDATPWFGVSDIQDYLVFFMLGMCVALHRERFEQLPIWTAPASVAAGLIVFSLQTTLGLAVAVLMIAGLSALSLRIAPRFGLSRNALYAQTYQIFILSWPYQLIVEIVTEKIFRLSFAVVMPLMFAAGLLMPIVTLRLIDMFEQRTDTHIMSRILGRG